MSLSNLLLLLLVIVHLNSAGHFILASHTKSSSDLHFGLVLLHLLGILSSLNDLPLQSLLLLDLGLSSGFTFLAGILGKEIEKSHLQVGRGGNGAAAGGGNDKCGGLDSGDGKNEGGKYLHG